MTLTLRQKITGAVLGVGLLASLVFNVVQARSAATDGFFTHNETNYFVTDASEASAISYMEARDRISELREEIDNDFYATLDKLTEARKAGEIGSPVKFYEVPMDGSKTTIEFGRMDNKRYEILSEHARKVRPLNDELFFAEAEVHCFRGEIKELN